MILKIFKRDLRGLSRNVLACVVALGLCLIPSLYAWFNIYSNWDPYANTSSIKIAIVSNDAGFTEADGSSVNMGDQIVEQLHSNDKLGWKFPSTEEEAMNGLYSGKYYAVIIVGEDFSSSLYDFLDNGLNPPTVVYYENSKKNAVASKITDTGKSTLETTINEQFINVCVETIMLGLNEAAQNNPDLIGNTLADIESIRTNIGAYSNMIDMFVASNSNLTANLETLQGVMPEIKDVLESSTDVADTADATLDNVTADISAKIDAQINAMDELADSISTYIDTALTLSKTDATKAKENLNSAKTQLDELMQQNSNLSDVIDSLGSIQGVDATLTQALKASLASMTTAESIAATLMEQCIDILSGSADSISAEYELLKAVVDKCNTEISICSTMIQTMADTSISQLKSSVSLAVNSIAESISGSSESIDGLTQILLGINDISVNTGTTLEGSKTLLGSLDSKLTELSDALSSAGDSSLYELAENFINSDADVVAEFLSEPVQVEEKYVYMETNYGTSVTPFYTTLALWVGGIVLVALMKVKVDYEDEEFAGATENQKYLGRAILFLAMGQLQAAIVVLGNLYILKIDCTNPFMFWLAAAITSLVYTLFIYTLVLTFGDLGKAIAVVMIILQIAGSGGTYPIELLPQFFQNVYLYFPFPYSINAMREAISGLYQCDYAIYLVKLSVYAVVSLVLGLGIRKSLFEVREFFERRMKETHFM